MKVSNHQIWLMTLMMILAFTSLTYPQGEDHTIKEESANPDVEKSTAFMINESNYNCFSDINCLKRQKELNVMYEGGAVAGHYILKGQSRNEQVYAEYDKRGKLIKSRLVQVNAPVPTAITRHIASGEYAGWKIIGNEKTVLNFNPKTTEYKVILQKDDEGTVLYFDRFGNPKIEFMGV